MTLANAHALFCGLKSEPSYLANLTVSADERTALLAAQQDIRAALKAAAAQVPLHDEYWQEDYARKVFAHNRPAIVVKFMTQGSFAYKTLNAPAQAPHQEIDLDDGMYVPVRFLDNGEPALAAKGLFAFTEATLAPLCLAKRWQLDTSKDCCVRVRIWPGAHIDLPIYSIPEDRFEQLRESLAKSVTASMAHDSVQGGWKLPSDQIMLAHRSGKWAQSDPQLLHDWVQSRYERYGAVYRRLSRFFKGWRDHVWRKPRLSSVCIMTAVDTALRDLNGFPTEERDDELIMNVASKLPDIFGGNVANPVLSHLCLNEWSDAERAEIVREARLLRDEMITALERTGDAEQVVRKLRDRFGARLPYRPDSVKIASTIAAVQSSPAARVAAPKVIPSTSG